MGCSLQPSLRGTDDGYGGGGAVLSAIRYRHDHYGVVVGDGVGDGVRGVRDGIDGVRDGMDGGTDGVRDGVRNWMHNKGWGKGWYGWRKGWYGLGKLQKNEKWKFALCSLRVEANEFLSYDEL